MAKGHSKHVPRIKTHNSATIKASIPSFKSNAGLGRVQGNFNTPFPKIAGFNAPGKNPYPQTLIGY